MIDHKTMLDNVPNKIKPYLNKSHDLSSITKDLLIQEIRAPKRSLNRSIQECIAEGFIIFV